MVVFVRIEVRRPYPYLVRVDKVVFDKPSAQGDMNKAVITACNNNKIV